MAKLVDKLWNWGHLEGSHNKYCNMECSMTPEQFAEEYGIKNAFIISYGGNIQPPFDDMAKRFSCLNNVKWSVIGDASSPLPEDRLADTNAVIDASRIASNITGAMVDDFFSPKRMERFTPEVLKEIKNTLNAKGLDFWCVLYDEGLDLDLDPYKDCFDGISFWIWHSRDVKNRKEYLEKVFKIADGKPVMLGIYLWDYAGDVKDEIPDDVFEGQLKDYFDLLIQKKIEGVIFCSGTIGDAKLSTNKILKKYISEYGTVEIEDK